MLVLYGTEACHLCGEAQAMLQASGLNYQYQDIIDNDTAYQRYALLIPVLLHLPSQQQLNWPFSEQMLNEFIKINRGQTTFIC